MDELKDLLTHRLLLFIENGEMNLEQLKHMLRCW